MNAAPKWKGRTMTDIHAACALACVLCVHLWLAVCIVVDARREKKINDVIIRGYDRETPQ